MGRLSGVVRLSLVLIFCFSGAAALAYQVLWTRQLTLILGASAIAVSTVLGTFMAGLGLGAHLAGRWADRTRHPLLLYGLAELGIGLFALLTPVLFSASGSLYLALYRFFQGIPFLTVASRALAAGLILIIPTTLMGATLPLVARFYIRRLDRLGHGLGLLYGINTLGGVLGAAAVGYFLIFFSGIRFSLHIAALVNVLVALVAIIISLSVKGRGAA
jgi:spermidine synthase